MNIVEEIKKIKDYLSQKYNIKELKKKEWMDDSYLLFKIGKDDKSFDINLCEPNEDSYAPKDYLMHFGYGNGYTESGYADPYKGTFDIVDQFILLHRKDLLTEEKQLTIFDCIGE